MTVSAVLSAVARERNTLLQITRELVAAESPSDDRPPLDDCGRLLARWLATLGAAVERVPAQTTTDHVMARWPGRGPAVLLVGHFDTVWPVGQLERMPIAERDGKLFGPGVLDMKAGLAIGMTAAHALATSLPESSRPAITLIATSDEEVGSRTSRAIIEQLARESAAVLVLEPALPGGGLKTARKGVGEFEVIAEGVSSHAGADPRAGASAVHELARQIVALEALADPDRGLTLNVGVIEGGTRSNVVAERARAIVDVRIARAEDAARIEQAVRTLQPRNPRVRLTVRGAVNRPPMERTPGVARLFDLARQVAADLDRPLSEGATGGASDGNFTAALGVPTLDGLGAVGDGPHALHEHVIVDELIPRASLVAGLMARL
jgi:glutamate carboxypeptidase